MALIDEGARGRVTTIDSIIKDVSAASFLPSKTSSGPFSSNFFRSLHFGGGQPSQAVTPAREKKHRPAQIHESVDDYVEAMQTEKGRARIYESIDEYVEAMSEQRADSGAAHPGKALLDKEGGTTSDGADLQLLKKAHQMTLNRVEGQAFSQERFRRFKEQYPNAQEEIYIMPNFTQEERKKYDINLEKGSGKVRVDAIARRRDGKVIIQEYKASATAPFTRNQKNGYDVIRERGGEVRGKGKGVFVDGFKFSSADVQVVRPEVEKEKKETEGRSEGAERSPGRPRFRFIFN
ncbi:hypothetical protein AGDE_12915 [Angomonas deanei]|nr:hypothetical protein AGDE_12915 [Angomonas deanei]|eukprot:EPY23291.1 hypothetical protein AGDE_12915 [Angomonas deanei]